jgi:hypothetical protein
MKRSAFWYIMASTAIAEEHVISIIRVEEYAEQRTKSRFLTD